MPVRWLRAQPPDLEETRQALGRIVIDGSRAGEVIDRIRALVKKVPPRRELLHINEAIRDVIALTQTEVQQNRVKLQARLADDLALVPADRVQLQQVIKNLLVNAVEAISNVGDGSRELTIASGKDDRNAVFVEVQDTGPGLDPKKLDRLFQSFYTTKPDGIGLKTRDQPIDYRGPWRAPVGSAEQAPRRRLPIDAAGRRHPLGCPGPIAALAGTMHHGPRFPEDLPKPCPAYTQV
jgi:signal transduction histidine kinase